MRRRKRPGQAVVELALFITLIYLLLSATVDFGLAYFVYQGIAGAAQEGASFGSLKPMAGTVGNDAEIRQRARNEGGLSGNRRGFVNLFDLDSANGDDTQAIQESHITISIAKNPDAAATGMSVECDNDNRTPGYCDIIVSVKYFYKPQFSFAKTFGAAQVTLTASRRSPINR